MPKDRRPAFQFYPADWLSSSSVSLMTPAEEGAYIRLLCHAWMAEDGGLPADDESLAELSRLRGQWKKSGTKIRRKFEQIGERLFNPRLTEERVKQDEFREEASRTGKAGAEARWGKRNGQSMGTPSEEDRVPIETPMPKNGSSSSSSSLKNSPIACASEVVKMPARKPQAADLEGVVSSRFAEFWERYPQRSNRASAESWWVSLVTTENEAAVFACLERFLASADVARGFVKEDPARWLQHCSQDGWETGWARARDPTAAGTRKQKSWDQIIEAL